MGGMSVLTARSERIAKFSISPDKLEVAQARLLLERARGSAISVFCLLSVYSLILTFTAPVLWVIAWFVAAAVMILVTLWLPFRYRRSGINDDNVSAYLHWHTLITCITGAVWGGGAAALTDLTSETSIFTTGVVVLSITLGGISPQSAYRRSYVGLATFVMLPYATWVLFAADWPFTGVGVGVLLAYAFFMSASARVEIGTRDMLAIKQNKVLIDELSRQHIALRRANEEKTRFLAATSHDLAQPLHAQGFYIAALRETTTDEDQLALLSKIEASWRGLGHLLNGLVDVSRLDAGVIVPDLRVIDMAALVRRVGDEFAAVAADRDIRLIAESPSAPIRTDPLILIRILRNLISNAVKFTEPGGVVHLGVTEEEDGTLKLIVEDTGCGIAADKLATVFEEYVQLGNHERDREKGLGLGLAIVRRLVRLLDLNLEFTSEPGVGTTAALKFKRATGMPMPLDSADQKWLHSTMPIGNLCVFLVDNEDAIRAGMTTVLTSWGCQVYSAESANEVIEILNQTGATPNVLLVDQRLSEGESGLQLIERVRDEINDSVPAIIMTGDITNDRPTLDTPNLSLIYKPVEPDQLHNILRSIALDLDAARERNKALQKIR